MCGIAGVINFNQKPVEESLTNLMTNELVHRGPDGEGHWLSQDRRLGFGHRRLSIIDLSNAASQPMHYANGRYTITFNGEIYNYKELRCQLEKLGYSFKNESDTEVLLAIYDHNKEDCLKKLDGMFAFAIWDEKKKVLFCARDRFGEKPFFYFKDNDRFVFASEIKALWKAGVKKVVDPQKMYEFLMYNVLRNPDESYKTFYKNVFELEQSHYLQIDASGKITKKKYWKVDLAKQNRVLSLEDSTDRFRELLSISVDRRLRSDVSVGSSLSGGLDSSSIVAMVHNSSNKPIKFQTFSARFKNFEKDEGDYIKVVSNQYGFPSAEVFPSEESIRKNFKKLIYHQDEPFGSLSIEAQFEVFELAKNSGATVLLDGQGADEFLAGYKRMQETYYYQLAMYNKPMFRSEQQSYYKNHDQKFNKPSLLEMVKRRKKSIYQFADNQRRKALPLNHSYFLGIHPNVVDQARKNKNPILKAGQLKDHLSEATFRSGLVNLLRFADRNSMAHSVEVRLPFLYHELVEFVFSLPDSFLIRNAWTKYILRKSMEHTLPNEIVWRKDKVGFATPQNSLLESEFFQEKKSQAVNRLKADGIIKKANSNLDWQYIMLSEFTT